MKPPGATDAEATRVMGGFIRDIIEANRGNFRIVSPDETASNRWNAVFEATNRMSAAQIIPTDDHVAPDGRAMEVLSEHMCQGWLEGYLLTGRHGFFLLQGIHPHHRFDVQPARQVAESNAPHRMAPPIASLNYLLTSGVRITTASVTRTPDSSIMSLTRRPRWSASIFLPMPTHCSPSLTIASRAVTTST